MTAATRPSAYDSALAYLYGRLNYERPRDGLRRRWVLNLERMRRLLAQLGNPQDAFPIVHVAGTKGKGSTATMIAASLTAAGRRTGLYTSPHLECLEQRMQIDGVCCTPDELLTLVDAVRPAVEQLDAESDGDKLAQPTFFEITTAMALVHFRARRVGAVVLEVGLGGRLDSTNVCLPRVSVITSISFDHTEQLGETLALIAAEKAGIIKPGVPVVTGVTQAEPLAVIESIARERGASLRRLDHEFHYTYFPPDACRRADAADVSAGVGAADSLPAGIAFQSDEPRVLRAEDSASRQATVAKTTHRSPPTTHQFPVGMWGRHQATNAAVAVETLLELRRQGWDVPDAAIRDGLRTARCPARVEVVARRPTVIVDVAHNVASIAALIEALDERFPRRTRTDRTAPSGLSRTLIFAASSDKDVPGMLRLLLPAFDRVLLTRYRNNPRSTAPEQLRQIAEDIEAESRTDATKTNGASSRCSVHLDPREALQAALTSATPEHVVCVAGSLFLAAELLPVMRSLAPNGDEVVLPAASPSASTSSASSTAPLVQPLEREDSQLLMAKPAT